MKQPSEQELLEAARRLLEKSERECDELTVARLRAVRLRALDAARRRGMSWWSLGSVVSAGIAAAVAGLLWFGPPSELSAPRPPQTAGADIDLLTTKESPEFYTELDFYDWLANDADAS